MLEVKNLSIELNSRFLIRDLSFVLNKKDKLAIIGEEGNGKTSLIKAILGINNYCEITGNIKIFGTIGYLAQEFNKEELQLSVRDYLFASLDDYYDALSNLYYYLEQVDLAESILNREKLETLSGGEKIKVGLLKLIIQESDILILDEPTNNLDLKTLEFLEQFLKQITKPIIFISHDEQLIENVANMLLHLEIVKKKTECKHTITKLKLSEYKEYRNQTIEKNIMIANKEEANFKKQQARMNQIMQKVEHQQNTISRSDPHGGYLLKKKMKSIKSMEKRINKEKRTDLPSFEESIEFFINNNSLPNKKRILDLHQEIFNQEINLEIYGNEHIVITGNNGVGKTRLLKIIYDLLKIRKDLNIFYMPQNYFELLPVDKTPIEYLTTKVKIEDIRSRLGSLNVTKDEMISKINQLSGGTKAKIFLCELALSNANVLILDEPTRNFSPLSTPVLIKSLKNFNGAIIAVTHDRAFINVVSDKIYVLEEDKLVIK